MRRLLAMCVVVVLLSGIALAQRGATLPPTDYGIGNQSLSPNAGTSGDINNNISYSPDVNQMVTNTTGSTVGDNYPNAAFGGYSGWQTSSQALAQGSAGAVGESSAETGAWAPLAVNTSALANFVTPESGSGFANATRQGGQPNRPAGAPSTKASRPR